MEIISVVPRGYCQGVVRAIQIARQTARENRGTKVTMLGMIVHNQYVVDACRKEGIEFVEDPGKTREELLDEIDEGIVIFTAHGISPSVRHKAVSKGLQVVDASCRDVIRTHQLVTSAIEDGMDVLYIGKKGHPESEGTVGLSQRVHLITCVEDVKKYPHLDRVFITNQTTLSLNDTSQIIKACLQMYPSATVAKEICNATTIRQQAVMKLENVDLLIVVGDPRSNNSNQLARIGKESGIPESLLIESAQSLNEQMVQGKNRIAVTSGSSTPNEMTAQVIDCLKQYASTGVFEKPEPIEASLL